MNFMELATNLAKTASKKGEVPIGAVIVKNNKVISKAFNTREKDQIATHHAEVLAIEKACKKLKSWRLDDCELFVTLEPCPMCAGAILNSRIKKVYYSLPDNENGGITKFNLLNNVMNHSTEHEHLEEYQDENLKIIQNFFKNKRKINKNSKKIRKN